MIPKIIHYCWFGPRPMSELHRKCLESWKRRLPDFELKKWDESNSPMHLPYLQKARDNRQWANMANYVRLHALYTEGGVYFDVDAEVLRRFDSLLRDECFLGFEEEDVSRTCVNNAVMGAVPRHPFVQEAKWRLLCDFDGTEDSDKSSPGLVDRVLKDWGLREYGDQYLRGVHLLPRNAFYPVSWEAPEPERLSADGATGETLVLHHFGLSWKKESAQSKRPGAGGFWRSCRRLIVRVIRKALRYCPFLDLVDEALDGLKEERFLTRLRRGSIVRNGPFRGLACPELSGDRAALSQKLVGCYESALHEEIYRLVDCDYRQIIVLGCRDGYYAVGLARLFPGASVRAYAIDEETAPRIDSIAKRNQVSLRVKVLAGQPDSKELMGAGFSERTLILSTAEGFESQLMDSPSLADQLRKTDLIARLRNFSDSNSYCRILELFEKTHTVSLLPDAPTQLARYPELAELPVAVAARVLGGVVAQPGGWITLRAKMVFS